MPQPQRGDSTMPGTSVPGHARTDSKSQRDDSGWPALLLSLLGSFNYLSRLTVGCTHGFGAAVPPELTTSETELLKQTISRGIGRQRIFEAA